MFCNVLLQDGQLEIKKIVPEDSGIYKCVAKNEMGEDSSSAKIEVEGTVGFSWNRLVCLVMTDWSTVIILLHIRKLEDC